MRTETPSRTIKGASSYADRAADGLDSTNKNTSSPSKEQAMKAFVYDVDASGQWCIGLLDEKGDSTWVASFESEFYAQTFAIRYNRHAEMLAALEDAEALIGVMFGQGEDAIIPETVTTPLGVPAALGDIMRSIRSAIEAATPTSKK
jgi:hypothetical protein